MKKLNNQFLIASLVLLFPLSGAIAVNAEGDATSLKSDGSVRVKGSDTTELVDPENPETVDPPVDPGPSTKGDLRIDYVSSVDFGTVKLTKTNRTYKALANKIGKDGKLRGNFIQVSDFREKGSGWTLQVKQESQFQTKDYDELTGAVLSLDKGWANSSSAEKAPTVTRDTLSISNIGQVYDVARATENAGGGVWSINFGASKDNDDNQPTTITEDAKSSGKEKAGKIARNSAVKITIPDSTKVAAKEYQTKITWILSDTP